MVSNIFSSLVIDTFNVILQTFHQHAPPVMGSGVYVQSMTLEECQWWINSLCTTIIVKSLIILQQHLITKL